MVQPSNANRLTRNINARIPRALWMQLTELTADRGITIGGLLKEMVIAYLDAAAGRSGAGCGCVHCIADAHNRKHFQDTLFDVA